MTKQWAVVVVKERTSQYTYIIEQGELDEDRLSGSYVPRAVKEHLTRTEADSLMAAENERVWYSYQR